jgi:glycosyltransferase involved in cell wall biosynthesis
MVSPAKILVVTPLYDPLRHDSGAVMAQLLPQLAQVSATNLTWATAAQAEWPVRPLLKMLPMQGWLTAQGCAAWLWPLGPGRWRQLRQAVSESQLVWLHDTWYPAAWLVWRWARQHKKPILLTLHERTALCLGDKRQKTLHGWLDQHVTRPMLIDADQVVFSNDKDGEDYHRTLPFRKPVKIVPNGVDLRTFHLTLPEKRRYLRTQFALRSEQPILLYVGNFTERKGLKVIHELAAQLPDWRFWLAGKGVVNPTAWNLTNIHVFPERNGVELAELYQAADLLLSPGTCEGFPPAIQEAMACGLPVMCSTETAEGFRPALPMLITEKVIPDDTAGTVALWRKKLLDLKPYLPLDGLKAELSDFAQAWWSWPKIATAYNDILTGMMPTKNHQP